MVSMEVSWLPHGGSEYCWFNFTAKPAICQKLGVQGGEV